jgi:3-oxoacyl-[acyl-carrier-protein] synthase-3
MSAACIPVALHEAASSGKIQRGDLVLMIAFGGGLTWSSVLIEY